MKHINVTSIEDSASAVFFPCLFFGWTQGRSQKKLMTEAMSMEDL